MKTYKVTLKDEDWSVLFDLLDVQIEAAKEEGEDASPYQRVKDALDGAEEIKAEASLKTEQVLKQAGIAVSKDGKIAAADLEKTIKALAE